MKTPRLLRLTLCVGAVLLLAHRGGADQPELREAKPTDPKDAFVVHEWGTFTSFSGSNSVKLEFRPLVSSDLPYFVFDRNRQAGVDPLMFKNFTAAMQRMETPVTYFYSEKPRQVQVRVDFPKGLLTEFYPPVEKMLPEISNERQYKKSGSSLDWGRVSIVPQDRLQVHVDDPKLARQMQEAVLKSIIPSAFGQDHYAHARETDSALVFVDRGPIRNGNRIAPHGGYFEKFLFYRGLGHFDLPLSLTASTGDVFELKNAGPRPIRSLFLVSLEGKQLRYSKYDAIAAGGKLKMAQTKEVSSAEKLAEDVVRALIAEGLYEKEARAMVKTWRSSWFEEQGTRLFYMLPSSTTEEILPLTITPRPDKMVRVMVGRLEIMRPEDEARVAKLVKESAKSRVAHHKADAKKPQTERTAYAPPASIVGLGRLAEPALVRIKNLTRDGEVFNEASTLMTELRLQQPEYLFLQSR